VFFKLFVQKLTFAARSEGNLHFDRVNVDQRQKSINTSYNDLVNLSQVCCLPDTCFVCDDESSKHG